MLICDLAETYHVTDYRSLPPSTVATFVAGLRDDSRLIMKSTGVNAPQNTILLATIIDMLARAYGSKVSVLDKLIADDSPKNGGHLVFDTPEELLKAMYGE